MNCHPRGVNPPLKLRKGVQAMARQNDLSRPLDRRTQLRTPNLRPWMLQVRKVQKVPEGLKVTPPPTRIARVSLLRGHWIPFFPPTQRHLPPFANLRSVLPVAH